MTSAGASLRWSWTKTICLDYVRLPRWLVNSGDRWAGRLADVLLPLIRRSGPVMREDVMRRRLWEVKCRGSTPLASTPTATPTPAPARNPDGPQNRRAARPHARTHLGKLLVQESGRKRPTRIGRWIQA
jgi:hypothetical protein